MNSKKDIQNFKKCLMNLKTVYENLLQATVTIKLRFRNLKKVLKIINEVRL